MNIKKILFFICLIVFMLLLQSCDNNTKKILNGNGNNIKNIYIKANYCHVNIDVNNEKSHNSFVYEIKYDNDIDLTEDEDSMTLKSNDFFSIKIYVNEFYYIENLSIDSNSSTVNIYNATINYVNINVLSLIESIENLTSLSFSSKSETLKFTTISKSHLDNFVLHTEKNSGITVIDNKFKEFEINSQKNDFRFFNNTFNNGEIVKENGLFDISFVDNFGTTITCNCPNIQNEAQIKKIDETYILNDGSSILKITNQKGTIHFMNY